MNFETHLFISYAHVDNKPTADDEGWITRFHKSLESYLSTNLGKDASIWRDDKLQGNDIFGDEIIKQFLKTALLISVLSRLEALLGEEVAAAAEASVFEQDPERLHHARAAIRRAQDAIHEVGGGQVEVFFRNRPAGVIEQVGCLFAEERFEAGEGQRNGHAILVDDRGVCRGSGP